MHPVHKTFFLLMVSVLLAGAATAPRITVDVKPGAAISPTMYGVFFEDINFGADGGLYAELVKNRSFEFDWPLRGWQIIRRDRAQGRILILHDAERPRNPRHIRILLEQQGDGFGLQNEGFRGMGIRQGADYRFSVAARAVEGTIGALRVELVDQAGRQIAESHLNGLTAAWRTHQCHLRAGATTAAARLNVWFTGEGVLDLDMVSLFPTATWKGRDNGLRADLVQLLADLQPGFIRFPGGCIVEGFNLSQRYQWKNSIGPVDQRVVTINRWNFEFKHRPTPDYYQSYGLGFYEYFLLAEDLGAEPMPIVNCGMACQFNTAELAP
ncbi:alpha-L-arabinofuranosidase, partial [candidate division KSB1 bacterium]